MEHGMMNAAAGGIDEYLLKRLRPVEGAIPRLPGIEMYGNSVPAGTVGGDLFEYINFQQRYDIDARIGRALKLAESALLAHAPRTPDYSAVDELMEWIRQRPDYDAAMEAAYRRGRRLEQLRIAEDLNELHSTAGVLLVDAQGHGVISAKIASTVHDTFHAFMLSELDHHGKITPELFEQLNIRLARSLTARNALGRREEDGAREIATMLYGEIRPSGDFRFVNFGHPPPLLFSAKRGEFVEVDRERMVQFLPLGLEVPEDYPDRKRYFSVHSRQRPADYSDIAELKLMHPEDMLLLYSDGVYDGTDEEGLRQLEAAMREYRGRSAKEVCNAVLDCAVRKDSALRDAGEDDLIDDKTVFIIKRSAPAA
jgi:serine phosphatase RsbU (regulator of sigma subunit)